MAAGTPRFIRTMDGIDVMETDLISPDGRLEATILGWGGILKDLHVRLADGSRRRVVLGFGTLDDYIAHSPHFGATAGRYANRIAHGRFTLDGVEHQLTLNQEGKHSLHGGGQGFGKQPWATYALSPDRVLLRHASHAGFAGYPGSVGADVEYRLGNDGVLAIDMQATVSEPTIINLCHHSYFNLGATPDVLGHRLMIDADHFTPVDADLIPTGEIRRVEGTPFDRRVLAPIGRPDPADPAKPFRTDHNFVLHKRINAPSALEPYRPLHRAAVLEAPQGDLRLEVWTDAPGLQAYDGHKVNTPVPGAGGAAYGAFAGICLESQNFPDAPNHAHFPDPVVRPSSHTVPNYRHVVEYRFLA